MVKGRPLLRWAGMLLVCAVASFVCIEARGEKEAVKAPQSGRPDLIKIDTLAAFGKLELPPVTFFNLVHVSFDADVLDPEIAPGVGTPVPGGLSYREAHLLMELFADSGRVTSLDLVEVNPILDRENRTANLLVGLAASLLGQKIY